MFNQFLSVITKTEHTQLRSTLCGWDLQSALQLSAVKQVWLHNRLKWECWDMVTEQKGD